MHPNNDVLLIASAGHLRADKVVCEVRYWVTYQLLLHTTKAQVWDAVWAP